MNFDFPLFLVCLTFAAGAIALLDILVLKRFRSENAATPTVARECRSLFPILIIVLIIRSFLFQPFRVPTGSLEPTVMPGDFIAVNMFNLGLRLPVWHYKIFANHQPKTGEIVLFRWPVNPKVDFVKRVVGTPGDHISYINKTFYINGKKATQHFIRNAADSADSPSQPTPVKVYEENLNGVKHKIYINPEAPSEDFKDLVVPANHYFMIGDNRDNSGDSRYWGFVPDSAIIGKAFRVIFNWNSNNSPTINWQRIGNKL